MHGGNFMIFIVMVAIFAYLYYICSTKINNRKQQIFQEQARTTEFNLQQAENLELSHGVFLGLDGQQKYQQNNKIIISDKELNGHVYIGGTTGSGKTVTLKNFILSAIKRGIPLIYLDGKGDQKLPQEIEEICNKYNRQFKLFEMTPTSKTTYNPLSTGGFTELKDKIMTMKTSSNDDSGSKFYQTAEGEYLQFVFRVMQKAKENINLYNLGKYITMPNLFELISTLNDQELQKEARELKDRIYGSLSGLISDINTFIRSDIGHLFKIDSSPITIDLWKDLQNNSIIYFSLNDLNYPEYANRLGKLIINDIKSVFGRIPENTPLKTFAIFDEFTTYAGEQFNTILSRTRSKGVHAIIGSQSFDTIDKISPKLASDLVANCNTFIIHRQNSDIDAEKLSDIIGKKEITKITHRQLNQQTDHNNQCNQNSFLSCLSSELTKLNTLPTRSPQSQTRGVTISTLRENRINPEQIQSLKDGQAYILRKRQNAEVTLVEINFIQQPADEAG